MRFAVKRTSYSPVLTDGCTAQKGIFRHKKQTDNVQELAWYVRDFENLDEVLEWADGLADGPTSVNGGIILSKNNTRDFWDLVQGDEMPEREIEIWDDYH
jgi:hypothetical protein